MSFVDVRDVRAVVEAQMTEAVLPVVDAIVVELQKGNFKALDSDKILLHISTDLISECSYMKCIGDKGFTIFVDKELNKRCTDGNLKIFSIIYGTGKIYIKVV